jgi:ketosteroid isomerase-like protein
MSEPDDTEAAPLVREALAALEAIDFDHYMALWHEECRVEYPTAFPGMPRLTLGKENLAEHNRRAFHGIDRRELHDLEIRPLADPSFALAEFELDQSFGGGAGRFRGRVCVIFGARDGRLAFMREYMDTRLLAESLATYAKTVAPTDTPGAVWQ